MAGCHMLIVKHHQERWGPQQTRTRAGCLPLGINGGAQSLISRDELTISLGQTYKTLKCNENSITNTTNLTSHYL